MRAVLAAGYDLIVEETHKEERQEEEQHKRYVRLKRKVIGAWILVVPLLVFSMILMHMPYSNEIRWYCYSCYGLFRWWFLYRSLETGKDRTEQYGYFGCTQYFHCVSVQPF